VVISPSPVPTESPVPTASQTPTASPTRIATLAPTATPNPTATPLAGPWRRHTRLASTHDAVLVGRTFLADGRVLVLWDEALPGIEAQSRSSLYDPVTDTWTELATPWDYQVRPPGWLPLVGLADGSAVAVLGPAEDDAGARTQSAVFDPVEGAWLPPVDAPITDQSAHFGVLLGDGRVLMFWDARTYLFDPATASWNPGPTLPFDNPASAAVLDDGSVLALAVDGHAARLLPGGTTWQRSGRAAVGNGAYVIAIPGGAVALGGSVYVEEGPSVPPDPRTAVYRADTDRWSPGPDGPPIWDAGVAGPGKYSLGVLLADNSVLVAGGWGGMSDYDCLDGAAILSVDAGAWQSIEPMPACLVSGIGQLRADGTVLIVGEGYDSRSDDSAPIGIEVLSYVP
jgi:hypothetical protein